MCNLTILVSSIVDVFFSSRPRAAVKVNFIEYIFVQKKVWEKLNISVLLKRTIPEFLVKYS